MANVTDRLDEIESKVMGGLKDFQRATVDRIDYLYRHGQKRVLVSDEVGLGKTLIARGTVAKVAQLRHEEGDGLFKVVYICSNSAIADQNLRKLRITHEARTENASSSRLSMQHLNIFLQENDPELLERYIQLIPLTPDTSFRMTSGSGKVQERALMYVILTHMPELSECLQELETVMMGRASTSWNDYKSWYAYTVNRCNQQSNGRYIQYMQKKLLAELSGTWKDGLTYIDAFKGLCEDIRHHRSRRISESSILGQLRVIFAKISLEKLEPDLVIRSRSIPT